MTTQPSPSVSSFNLTNGSAIDLQKTSTDQSDHRVPHKSRLSSFQRSGNSSQLPLQLESSYQSNSGSHLRSYSPYQAYQNHIASLKDQNHKNITQVNVNFMYLFADIVTLKMQYPLNMKKISYIFDN